MATSILLSKCVSLYCESGKCSSQNVIFLYSRSALNDRADLIYTTSPSGIRTIQSYVSGKSSLRIIGCIEGDASRYRAFGGVWAGSKGGYEAEREM